MWLSKCTRAYKLTQYSKKKKPKNILSIYSFRKHQSIICVNFTELCQVVYTLFKLSMNFLTVPRMFILKLCLKAIR